MIKNEVIRTATVEYRELESDLLNGLFWVLSVNGADIYYSVSADSARIEANRLLSGETAISKWKHYVNPNNVKLG